MPDAELMFRDSTEIFDNAKLFADSINRLFEGLSDGFADTRSEAIKGGIDSADYDEIINPITVSRHSDVFERIYRLFDNFDPENYTTYKRLLTQQQHEYDAACSNMAKEFRQEQNVAEANAATAANKEPWESVAENIEVLRNRLAEFPDITSQMAEWHQARNEALELLAGEGAYDIKNWSILTPEADFGDPCDLLQWEEAILVQSAPDLELYAEEIRTGQRSRPVSPEELNKEVFRLLVPQINYVGLEATNVLCETSQDRLIPTEESARLIEKAQRVCSACMDEVSDSEALIKVASEYVTDKIGA